MARRHREMQHLIRQWKEETGNIEIDMHAVAEYAAQRGWPIPPPVSGMDRLAKDFSQAAREETRQDSRTGKPYRVYHAFPSDQRGQGTLWVDIDEAPRRYMHKSAVMRREQMVGDAVQLTLDLEHWNRVNPSEEPIVLPMDLSEDVQWRLNGPDEAAA
jgi:hypothetical protein